MNKDLKFYLITVLIIFLMILLVLLSSCDISSLNDEYVYIQELEEYAKGDVSDKEILIKVDYWIYENIDYVESVFLNKSASRTYRDKEGECQDRLVLFVTLINQYINTKPDKILVVLNRKKNSQHIIAKYDNYTFGLYEADRGEYYKNGKILVIKRYSYDSLMMENNCF